MAVGDTLTQSRHEPGSLDHASGPRGSLTPTQRSLDFLIFSARTSAEAAQKGVVVSSAEAEQALRAFRSGHYSGASSTTGQDVQRLLTSKGVSEVDRVAVVKTELLAERLEQRLRSEAEDAIPDAAVASYYVKNRRRFVAPELRDVFVVQTHHKSRAERARREMTTGQSPQIVVKRQNEAPKGGRLLGITRNSITRGYEHSYFKSKLFAVVGPLRAQGSYYVFQVSYIAPAHQRPLTDVQATIRQELLAGPQRRILTELGRARDREWIGKTRCTPAYLVARCGGRL
jgi:hypothetical protein